MDPQQEIFTKLLVELKKLGYGVYDGALPPENTPYPFIYLADNQTTDNRTKNTVMATVNQTIHVWHSNPRERGTVSSMLYAIKQISYGLKRTRSFKWDLANVNQRIISDSTTNTPLLHGIVELEFRMIGGIRK